MNDDAQEKAVRLQSRQALQDLQLNQIRAAVTPMRRLQAPSHNRAASSSPRTPEQRPRGAAAAGGSGRDGGSRRAEYDDDLFAVAGANIVSPVKRVPILANFEEWMKLATDNVGESLLKLRPSLSPTSSLLFLILLLLLTVQHVCADRYHSDLSKGTNKRARLPHSVILENQCHKLLELRTHRLFP